MPEGDTIFRSARVLAKVLTGKTITRFDTAYAHLATVNDDRPVAGRRIENVESRGKWLLIHLSDDLILVTHMLMSGSWHIYKTGEKWWSPRHSMRALLEVEGWQAVAFNVPVAEFHTASSLERKSSVPKLGPDLLSADYTRQPGPPRPSTASPEPPRRRNRQRPPQPARHGRHGQRLQIRSCLLRPRPPLPPHEHHHCRRDAPNV